MQETIDVCSDTCKEIDRMVSPRMARHRDDDLVQLSADSGFSSLASPRASQRSKGSRSRSPVNRRSASNKRQRPSK